MKYTEIEASIQPITRTVLRVRLNLTANFRYVLTKLISTLVFTTK